MTEELTLCDLTQSYSASGGGIRSYITAKRAFLDAHTPHRHVLIIPGARNKISHDGRHTTIEIASPKVPGSPNYRLLLRSREVIKALRDIRPRTIECLDAYNLPWAAIAYQRKMPDATLIAGYRTDFPTVYVEAIFGKFLGPWAGGRLKNRAYKYAGKLYSKFDGVYALEATMAQHLCGLGVADVDVLPLGTDIETFHPNKRDPAWRAELSAGKKDPILVYAGRLDKEKQADIVVEAFLKLPKDMNASLVMLGDGKLKHKLIERTKNRAVFFPGYVSDRAELAKILASSDIYVSAMAFETFGISIIEAQAAGLPVVGVNAGAMPARVPPQLGRLGPVGDAAAMADNIALLWESKQIKQMAIDARTHVIDNFSWQKTFERLFGHIYPKAMRKRPYVKESQMILAKRTMR